jgi:hypothetical protein
LKDSPVVIISPNSDSLSNTPTLLLGHLHENHYYSLEASTGILKRKQNDTIANSPQKQKKSQRQIEQRILDMIEEVPSMSRSEVIATMDVPSDGSYNTEYARDPTLDDTYTLLGFNNHSRYWALLYEQKFGSAIRIENGHYYLSPEEMEIFCQFLDDYRKYERKTGQTILYVDIVVVFWLFKKRKLHILKDVGNIIDSFLYLSVDDAQRFGRFRDSLLQEWKENEEN